MLLNCTTDNNGMRLCRRLSFDDVLKCSLGLSKSEVRTMRAVLKMRQPFTVNGLAEKMGKDRSVVQRHLKKLGEKGILLRFQQNRDGGGYEFVYRTIDKKEMKKILRTGIKQFTRQVETIINRL